MKADMEDKITVESRKGGSPLLLLLALMILIAIGVGYWLTHDGVEPELDAVEAIKPAVVERPQPDVPATPDIPRTELEPVVAAEPVAAAPVEAQPAVEHEPLPTPAQADEMLRRKLDVAGADAKLDRLVSTEHTVDITAALLDGASRGNVNRKLLPMDPPSSGFEVYKEQGTVYMSEIGFERYNGYADTLTSMDSNTLVSAFHQMRPLYERAYEGLGLDPDDFDNAIIRTLDLIIATPEVEEPIALKQKSVVYTFADPELEALPPLQKQLLRMGPDNIRRIKAYARELRVGLLGQ